MRGRGYSACMVSGYGVCSEGVHGRGDDACMVSGYGVCSEGMRVCAGEGTVRAW